MLQMSSFFLLSPYISKCGFSWTGILPYQELFRPKSKNHIESQQIIIPFSTFTAIDATTMSDIIIGVLHHIFQKLIHLMMMLHMILISLV